jgi:hypothetical protein
MTLFTGQVLDLGRGRVWLHRSALWTLHVRVPLLLLTKCISDVA